MCAGGGGSRCEWILQDLMWAMVCSFGLADPADALIRLFGGFAQFAVGGLLVRGDHSSADVSLVGDPSGGVQAVEQSGRRLVRPRRAWSRGRDQAHTSLPPGRTRIRGVHAGRLVLTATMVRGERANSSRGRGCRPARQSQPSGTSSTVSDMSLKARKVSPVMTLMARETVGWDTPSCSPITACTML